MKKVAPLQKDRWAIMRDRGEQLCPLEAETMYPIFPRKIKI